MNIFKSVIEIWRSTKIKATLTTVLASGMLLSAPWANQAAVASLPEQQPAFNTEDITTIKLATATHTPSKTTPFFTPKLEPLAPDAVQNLLSRLPALADNSEPLSFSLPADSLPAPKVSSLQQASISFKNEPAPQLPQHTPLQVVRITPQGAVPLASHIAVSFNQPMVALGSHAQAQGVQPVRMVPQVEGRWRWVGAQTLLFEAQERLPMATHYRVEVPAGTLATTGQHLQQAVVEEFRTPALTLKSGWPNSNQSASLDTVIVLEFDQAIDPEYLLTKVQLSADGTKLPFRLASKDELSSYPEAERIVQNSRQRYTLAIKPLSPLSVQQNISITIPAGTKSAEGPLLTEISQTHQFKTYGPFVAKKGECYAPCSPGYGWTIPFTNPIDTADFDPKRDLHIEPALADANIAVHGSQIVIHAQQRARTNYSVRLSSSIRDIYGQYLQAGYEQQFTVGAAVPRLFGDSAPMVILDPMAEPIYPIHSQGFSELLVTVYAVAPTDWSQWTKWLSKRKGELPGTQIWEAQLPVSGSIDELTTTLIDLTPALNDGLGQRIIQVTGLPQPAENERYAATLTTWVQRTQIGLLARSSEQLDVMAYNLQQGTHLPDVTLTLLGKHDKDEKDAELVEIAVNPEPRAAKSWLNRLLWWRNDASAKAATGKVVTDKNGIATLPLSDTYSASLVVATLGSDVALLPATGALYGGRGWVAHSPQDKLLWFVADDRNLYQAGETVHLKGWVRLQQGGVAGDLQLPKMASKEIHWRAIDPRGKQLSAGEVILDDFAGFALELPLPDNANLGHARIQFTVKLGELESTWSHSFQIQSYRRPEFEISVSASQPPHLFLEPFTTIVEANYYTGEPLANAELAWEVVSEPGRYRPTGHEQFSFGRAPIDWWDSWLPRESQDRQVESYRALTDADGKHELAIEIASSSPYPLSVRAQAQATDLNRQQWSASSTLLLHPSSKYVGVATKQRFVRKGESLTVEFVVVDLDGKLVPEQVAQITAERHEWQQIAGKWQQQVVERHDCQPVSGLVTDRAGKVLLYPACRFNKLNSGRWRIAAQVSDGQGRLSKSEITRWVMGGEAVLPAKQVENETVQLLSDRDSYSVGDSASILAQLPFYPAEVMLSWERDGLLFSETKRVTQPEFSIEIPISDSMTPGIELSVQAVGVAKRALLNSQTDGATASAAFGETVGADKLRPAMATGSLFISVPPLQRSLGVDIEPEQSEITPGGDARLHIAVKDAQGKPLSSAQVWLVVVDEAVLALTEYKLPDPLEIFYQPRASGVSSVYAASYIRLADQQREQTDGVEMAALKGYGGRADMAMMRMAMPTAMAETAGVQSATDAAIKMRTDFAALAFFAPDLKTDAKGEVEVEFTLPESLTRYRIMAIAADKQNSFGYGEAALTARLPLMVRPSLPRFLNLDDNPELTWLIHNQTAQPQMVSLAARATGLVGLADTGYRFMLPAGERAEVNIPAQAKQVGNATVQVAVAADAYSDAAQTELPIWTPAVAETFATYGTLDSGAVAVNIASADSLRPEFGGIEVSASSTGVASLTDALIYLNNYPYNSTEQIASRVIALASLKDVLSAFNVEGVPSSEKIEATLQSDIRTLESRQNSDGSFALWSSGSYLSKPWPYLTLHAALALAVAQESGIEVSAATKSQLSNYIAQIERVVPQEYAPQARWSLQALALYVQQRMGKNGASAARELVAQVDINLLPIEAQGWLLAVLADERSQSATQIETLISNLHNRVTETAATATYATHYGDHAHLLFYSERRVDAVVLEGLIAAQPDSALIAKTVHGLLAHRKQGHWGNTQENSWVLLALNRYFRQYESVAPDFVAKLWVGNQFVGEQAFQGRSVDASQWSIPMAWWAAQADTQQPLTLAHQGSGRLYYRLGARYVPADLQIGSAEHGFSVERVYEAVDDPADVTRDKQGVWQIKAGARVKVTLTMVVPARRSHVALVDRLPAGFEPLNPALAVTGSLPNDAGNFAGARGGQWLWQQRWYEHQNLRDERAEAFASQLSAGVYSYSYYARATALGQFVAPPTTVEEMYNPETFARAAAEQVNIVPSGD